MQRYAEFRFSLSLSKKSEAKLQKENNLKIPGLSPLDAFLSQYLVFLFYFLNFWGFMKI